MEEYGHFSGDVPEIVGDLLAHDRHVALDEQLVGRFEFFEREGACARGRTGVSVRQLGRRRTTTEADRHGSDSLKRRSLTHDAVADDQRDEADVRHQERGDVAHVVQTLARLLALYRRRVRLV